MDDEKIVITKLNIEYCDIDEPDTKNSVGQVSYEVLWRAGDQVAVINKTKGTVQSFTLDASAAGKKQGVFNADSAFEPGASDEIYIVYPYDKATLEGGKVYVTLDSEVSYSSSDNSAFSQNDIQVSVKLTGAEMASTDYHTDLNRVVAFFTVSTNISSDFLIDERVSAITARVAGISGKAEVKFSDGKPYVDANGGDNSQIACEITSSPKPKLAQAGYKVRFIPMYPISLTGGQSFLLSTENYEVGFYRSSGSVAKANNQIFQLFEGAYTRVNSEALATSNMTWWVSAKQEDFLDDSNAGAYANSSLPGSGAGSYGDGAPLSDE